jgi:sigma-B regulation protein RsbU (phosphoserine phosphatase)
MRHELRTPINHILGYCEMLLEESQLPQAAEADLRRIHAGGRELQALITRYFEGETFFEDRNLHNLYHELRTPVNHIVGYSDLLIEQADELGAQAAVPDLRKIRDAASNWLALMEAYLIEPALSGPADAPDPAAPAALALNLGFTFRVPEPKSSGNLFKDEGAILVVDDDESSREMLSRRLRRCGYTVSAVGSGLHALSLARRQKFDLVMLDMIMPGLDGFQVLAKLKAESALREIPVVMLSALDEENGIARCIEMGAEDYLAKPFNPTFMRARIGACLEKKRLRDREKVTYEALLKSQKLLAAELAEAAAYVRSLLPAPLSGEVAAEWCFHPSEQLGGDAFGYHWIDEGHLAIYLLDVCGHGVGAALLSVSVLNTIRAETLAGVDFRKPAQVLIGLNRVFQMERQNNLFFSIWYGVYQSSRRELQFSSGGHPPAILVTGPDRAGAKVEKLKTPGPPVGTFPDTVYAAQATTLQPFSRLFVFSDGAYEIVRSDGSMLTLEEFIQHLAERTAGGGDNLPSTLSYLKGARGISTFEDDLALMEVSLRSN